MENRPAASRTRPAVPDPGGRQYLTRLVGGGHPVVARHAVVRRAWAPGVGGWAAGERRGGGVVVSAL